MHVETAFMLLVKSLLSAAFSMTTWNTKWRIKQLKERHQETLSNYCTFAEEVSNYCNYFFEGFLDLFGKVILITFNFFLLDFSKYFSKSNVNKTVVFRCNLETL